MSAIARKLNITMGSLSTAMNSLVKKHYAERNRSESDRRVVNIRLTSKGRKAFDYHRQFHDRMTEAVLAHLSEDQVKVLAQALENLTTFFRSYGKETNKKG